MKGFEVRDGEASVGIGPGRQKRAGDDVVDPVAIDCRGAAVFITDRWREPGLDPAFEAVLR